MSFPLIQGIELLHQVQLALHSENETQIKSASEVLQEFINLSTDAVHRSNELALKFREISQRMKDEAKLLRDTTHMEALKRMKEYEQKIKEDACKKKELSEHDEALQRMSDMAQRMREESYRVREIAAQKMSDEIQRMNEESQ